jgi:uncharacterized protein (DUF342 family)
VKQPGRPPSVAHNRHDSLGKCLRIEVTDDCLKAELVVEPHAPPTEPLTILPLLALLKRHRITSGLRPSALQAALQRVNGFCRVAERFTVALGDPPEKGAEVLIQPAVSLALPRPNDLDRSQSLALAAVEACGAVVAGDILAEVRVDNALRPGRSVFGESLHPIHAALMHLELGPGVEADLHAERLFLRAKDAGMALLAAPRVDVLPLETIPGPLQIPSSGREYKGHVFVVGRVTGSGKLRTPGHLFVTRAVDGVDLEVGGSVVLGAGYLGRKSAMAICAGSFSTRTLERAQVEAGGAVYVVAGSVQSQITCGGELRVDGAIVGGSVTAGENIQARQIGSTCGTDTRIGINPVLRYRQALADLEGEIKMLKSRWNELGKLALRLQPRSSLATEDLPPSPELAKVCAEQADIGRKLKQQTEMRLRLLCSARAETARVRIIVTETLHPGAFLHIGESEAEIISARSSVQIGLAAESEEIHISPIPDSAHDRD